MPNLLASVTVAVATVLSVALLAIAIVSYRRVGRRRFLLLVGAFALFAVKSVALSIGLFTLTAEDLENLFALSSAFDAGILVVLYVALLKR